MMEPADRSQTVPPWADLLTEPVTPPWDHFRRPFDDPVSGIITSAPAPEAPGWSR